MLIRFRQLPGLWLRNRSFFSSVQAENNNSEPKEGGSIAKSKRRSIIDLPEKLCSLPLTIPMFPSHNPR